MPNDHFRMPAELERERQQTAHVLVRVAGVPHNDEGTFTQIRELSVREHLHRDRDDGRQQIRNGLVRVAAVPLAIIGDIPWVQINKLVLQAGFTSTVITSEDISGTNSGVGISWDGIDTPWCGATSADKLYLQSGQFTSTIKDSEDVSAIELSPQGISWDGADTPWCGADADKLYLQSGQFTSTLKTSQDVSLLNTGPSGISYDDPDTPWVRVHALTPDKLILQSGQFSGTIKTSLDVSAVEGAPSGISWDGANTPWSGTAGDKLYLQSGQFTSTIKESVDVGLIGSPTDVNTNRLTVG